MNFLYFVCNGSDNNYLTNFVLFCSISNKLFFNQAEFKQFNSEEEKIQFMVVKNYFNGFYKLLCFYDCAEIDFIIKECRFNSLFIFVLHVQFKINRYIINT